jgi:hypothetical protein
MGGGSNSRETKQSEEDSKDQDDLFIDSENSDESPNA